MPSPVIRKRGRVLEENEIDYEDFLIKLNLPDDKISLLCYDLYKYEKNSDKKDIDNNDRRENDGRTA